MTRYKRMLLGATAVAALAGGSPAFAFEVVDWTWDKTVLETVTINTTINDTLDPTGLVQVEKLQMHFGNLNATATVNNVHNNALPNGGGSGTVIIDETFNFQTTTDDSTNPSTVVPVAGTPLGVTPLTAELEDGTLDEGTDELDFDIRFQGELPVILDTAIDAIDLPKVENSATAVANNQSIEADVPIYLHDAQFAAGGFNPTCGDTEGSECPDAVGFLLGALGLFEVDGQLDGINEHTSIAGLMTIAAATGFVQPAEITATANVSDIINAYVENSATAVTNNASYTIESADPNNHIMIADLTQWGYANVSATATVDQVALNGYAGFGAAGLGGGLNEDIVPIVSNSATAVGNNLSIKVGVPSVD